MGKKWVGFPPKVVTKAVHGRGSAQPHVRMQSTGQKLGTVLDFGQNVVRLKV